MKGDAPMPCNGSRNDPGVMAKELDEGPFSEMHTFLLDLKGKY